MEPFYEILTSGPVPPARGKGSKGSKQASLKKGGERSAEIPHAETPGNPYSQKTEGEELDRLKEAIKTVEVLVKEEKAKLVERERALEELRKRDGLVAKVK